MQPDQGEQGDTNPVRMVRKETDSVSGPSDPLGVYTVRSLSPESRLISTVWHYAVAMPLRSPTASL